MPLEDFSVYLPQYLTEDASRSLLEELRRFPSNIDQRMYSADVQGLYPETILQGDGLDGCPVISLPGRDIRDAKVLVLSNTCDIDPDNPRLLPVRVLYAPIMSLPSLMAKLEDSGVARDRRESFLSDLRSQRLTQMLYLPATSDIGDESFVSLDHICSASSRSMDRSDLGATRLFSLSDYGFYLLLLKISYHFTRVGEGIGRTGPRP